MNRDRNLKNNMIVLYGCNILVNDGSNLQYSEVDHYIPDTDYNQPHRHISHQTHSGHSQRLQIN